MRHFLEAMEEIMDKIKISELEIYGHHGVMKEENVLGQKFLVSAELYTDIRKAGKSDDISIFQFVFMIFVMFILLMSFVKPLWFVINE